MKAGRSYTIDCVSTGVFDNFLRLEDPDGNQVAQDDDSGGNLNARIVHTPTRDGWYRVIVTTFSGELHRGVHAEDPVIVIVVRQRKIVPSPPAGDRFAPPVRQIGGGRGLG